MICLEKTTLFSSSIVWWANVSVEEVILPLGLSLGKILCCTLVFCWSFLFGLSPKNGFRYGSSKAVSPLSFRSFFGMDWFRSMSRSYFVCVPICWWNAFVYVYNFFAMVSDCILRGLPSVILFWSIWGDRSDLAFLLGLFGSSFVVIPWLTLLSWDRGICWVWEFRRVDGILMFMFRILWLLPVVFVSCIKQCSCFWCFSIFQLAVSWHRPLLGNTLYLCYP